MVSIVFGVMIFRFVIKIVVCMGRCWGLNALQGIVALLYLGFNSIRCFTSAREGESCHCNSIYIMLVTYRDAR